MSGNRSNINLVGNTTQGQNVGDGADVFKGKAGGNLLQFRTISATGTSIQIHEVGDNILISGATGGDSYWCQASGYVYPSAVNDDIRLNNACIFWEGASACIEGRSNLGVGYICMVNGTSSVRITENGSTAIYGGTLFILNTAGTSNTYIDSGGNIGTQTQKTNFTIEAGGSADSGTAGCINLYGGPNTSTGTGGNVCILGGSNTIGSGNGGGVILKGGASTSGTRGRIQMCLLPAKSSETNVVYIDVNGNLSCGAGGGDAFGWSNLANGSTVAGCGTVTGSTTGNTYYGVSAGTKTTTGTGNVGIGSCALASGLVGNYNTAVGMQALVANTSAQNTAIGAQAMVGNTGGYDNVAVGVNTIGGIGTGYGNVGVGSFALAALTNGFYNVGVGYQPLRYVTTGTNNIGMGYRALYCNTIGNNNNAQGNEALYFNVSGCHNFAVGATALKYNTTGCRNVAFGYESLFSNESGNDNVAIGYDALFNSRGSDNIAIGSGAGGGLGNVDTGSCNIALGKSSMVSIDTGCENIAIGTSAAGCLRTGCDNVAIGSYAHNGGRIGCVNVVVGSSALFHNTGGTCNVAVGALTLYDNANGNGNVVIGHNAGSGYTGSDIFWVANTGAGAYLVKGCFSNNTICNGANATTWNTTSDIRIKENIIPICNSIDVLSQLNPVIFDYNCNYSVSRNWNDSEKNGNYGFIAQEYELAFPKYVTSSCECVGDSVICDFKSINTGHLIPILVKAIQEQQQQIIELREKIDNLEKSL